MRRHSPWIVLVLVGVAAMAISLVVGAGLVAIGYRPATGSPDLIKACLLVFLVISMPIACGAMLLFGLSEARQGAYIHTLGAGLCSFGWLVISASLAYESLTTAGHELPTSNFLGLGALSFTLGLLLWSPRRGRAGGTGGRIPGVLAWVIVALAALEVALRLVGWAR